MATSTPPPLLFSHDIYIFLFHSFPMIITLYPPLTYHTVHTEEECCNPKPLSQAHVILRNIANGMLNALYCTEYMAMTKHVHHLGKTQGGRRREGGRGGKEKGEGNTMSVPENKSRIHSCYTTENSAKEIDMDKPHPRLHFTRSQAIRPNSLCIVTASTHPNVCVCVLVGRRKGTF